MLDSNTLMGEFIFFEKNSCTDGVSMQSHHIHPITRLVKSRLDGPRRLKTFFQAYQTILIQFFAGTMMGMCNFLRIGYFTFGIKSKTRFVMFFRPTSGKMYATLSNAGRGRSAGAGHWIQIIVEPCAAVKNVCQSYL